MQQATRKGSIIAPSFGDIFSDSCFENGLLAIALAQADVDALAAEASGGSSAST